MMAMRSRIRTMRLRRDPEYRALGSMGVGAMMEDEGGGKVGRKRGAMYNEDGSRTREGDERRNSARESVI